MPQDTLQSLLSSPNAPHIDQPTAVEQAMLEGYWGAVVKHLDSIREIRKSCPDWLPEFDRRPVII